jgi:serine/threonine protein kinase
LNRSEQVTGLIANGSGDLVVGRVSGKVPKMLCNEGTTWIKDTYLKTKQIGIGSMGCAWLVRSRDGPLLVAKEINVQGMSSKDTAEAVQEAEVLKQLQHPNIISMFEAFVEGPSLYIIMEFADAGDLSQVCALK